MELTKKIKDTTIQDSLPLTIPGNTRHKEDGAPSSLVIPLILSPWLFQGGTEGGDVSRAGSPTYLTWRPGVPSPFVQTDRKYRNITFPLTNDYYTCTWSAITYKNNQEKSTFLNTLVPNGIELAAAKSGTTIEVADIKCTQNFKVNCFLKKVSIFPIRLIQAVNNRYLLNKRKLLLRNWVWQLNCRLSCLSLHCCYFFLVLSLGV